MAYLYETHMHTCQASRCGKSTGREHVRRYRDMGFDGIIVTDHFFSGNCAVPRDLPWRERICRFCAGFEDAWEEGQKVGLDVFFAWEQNYENDEYLIYGPDKQWLLDHPEIEHASRARQLELVHEAGGAVIQAHPFRMRGYISAIRLGMRFADGAEVANAGNPPVQDRYAWHYAREYGLLMTAGSDNHDSSAIERPEQLFGVELEKKLGSIRDYAEIILRREPIGLHIPADRFEVDPAEDPHLESNWLTEDERSVPTGRSWFDPTLSGK